MTRIFAVAVAVIATIVAGFAVGALVNFLHLGPVPGMLLILTTGAVWAVVWGVGLLRLFEEVE